MVRLPRDGVPAYKLEHSYPKSGNRLSLERRGFIHKVISQKVLGTCAGTYLGTCAETYAGTCAGTYQGPVRGPIACFHGKLLFRSYRNNSTATGES